MEKQRTLTKEISISGKGLMLGQPVTITIKPAPEDYGIVFQRMDLEGVPTLKACPENYQADLPRCTSIGDGHTKINSVEHLLSALGGMGIDNAQIDVEGPELPSLDGSSLPYVERIIDVGITEQNSDKKFINLKSPIAVDDGERRLVLLPSSHLQITLVYDHPQLPTQMATFTITPEVYISEIAPSRSFCLASEVEMLKELGIGRGASYENVVVVEDDGSVSSELRFSNEFVRHKILDLIGDFYLAGQLPKANVIAIKSGHELHAELVMSLAKAKLIDNNTVHELVEAKDIYRILPHRFPMCMVDRVIEYEDGKRAVGIKNLSFNEQFFQGHFPQEPVMPGVLQIEGLAQLAAWLVLQETDQENQIGYFASINEAKFRKPVIPGDQLRLEVEVIRKRRSFVRVSGKTFVGDELTSEGDISIMIGSNPT
ncbi:3-hydroxyacyl-[acyl-carrier-protein] dehydratase FabZ [Candidatus Poribacteria bacterium]|nr:3-hydroxyacyl-[acyl-carrier-protein] dehydratase FabZ [Candidatus Poribacteria bacterium]